MREVGVDKPFPATDVGYSFSHLRIHSDCERRLVDIELDLSSCACTFEAVQWALSELQRMELEEPNFRTGDDANEDEADGSSMSRKAIAGGKILEKAPGRLRPAILDLEKEEACGTGANWTSTRLDLETLDDDLIKRDRKDGSPCGTKLQVQDFIKVDESNWRHVFKPASGGKRKSDEEASGNDAEKRPKVGELRSWSKSRELVIEADQGNAGKRMGERINSRLVVPECISLTNLIGHCLLVSMDQVPTKSIQEAVASLCLRDSGAADSVEGNDSNSGEWMWLHKWLVRTVLSDAGDDGPIAALDWLVAFLTSTHQSIIRAILDDLATDLRRREIEGSPTLATYMRRTGILEYAAIRAPERTFEILRPLFPPAVFPTRHRKVDHTEQRGACDELWHGWLGLMVLCPRLFGAFARLWVPTLSVEVVKLWKTDWPTTVLPEIWTTLVATYVEEPKTKREWLCAAMVRRLPELAPVASLVVELLSMFDSNEEYLGIGNYLLNSVYKELSKLVIPKVLGIDQDFRAELLPGLDKLGDDSDVFLFMQNLKQQAHVLWRKALEYYSTSECVCCQLPVKNESHLGSYERTGSGNDGSMAIGKSKEGCEVKASHDYELEVQRHCLFRDPLIKLCLLALLCSTDHVVADLLASASLIKPSSLDVLEAKSLRRLLMVMRVMRIMTGQGRGTLILELWAQQMVDRVTVASDEQALMMVLAMRQLLDPTFWQSYDVLLGASAQFESETGVTDDQAGDQGLSWELVWNVLRVVLDAQWLHILTLMHRVGAWELRLAVLGVLQLLNPDKATRPQAVAERLKGVLGIFFSWLESDGCGDKSVNGKGGTLVTNSEPRWKWQCARATEHLKSISIDLAVTSFPSFTLMVSSLLDFSFEHTVQTSTIQSPSSSINPLSRTELSLRRVGSASRSRLCVAPLSAGRLDRYGKLVPVSGPHSESRMSTGARQVGDVQLTEENRRIQSGAVTSLQIGEEVKSEDMTGCSNGKQSGQNAASLENLRVDLIRRSEVLEAELGSLLRRTLENTLSQGREILDRWPCHPVTVMATHLADRLETPHEVPMTMEQYEEVLPKHISSLRHIFLTDCFYQNPLLMEMVELVVKHGDNREVLRCVEFVRVLLADSISRWHSAFRTRWPHALPLPKLDEEEAWKRMQVNRLIQLVASANWLPQPLAASGEIVAVVDGADIADLLLLVWRCMHHAMAFGCKGWGGSSSSFQATGASTDVQATSTGSGADEEAGKEGAYTEWEGHFFAILRRNISEIGAHFAQVYPLRKAF